MKLTLTAQRLLIALFFAVVAVVYVIAWRAPSLGLFYDDAVWFLAGRELLAGRVTVLPPLFPMLIALFAAISQQVQWLKLLPVVCCVAWLTVSYKLLRRMGAQWYGALLLVGLTALSPAVVFISTNLLAEPLFGFLIAASLLALLDDRMYLSGALAALATLTLSTGLPLIAACALTLIVRRRLRQALIFTATAVVITAPWFGWSLAHAPNPLVSKLAANEKIAIFGNNLVSLFFAPFTLLSGISDMYAAMFTVALILVCLWKRRQLMPDIFLLFYCLMLLCRAAPPEPLLAPVLPLVLWLFWRTAQRIPKPEIVAAILIISVLMPLWGTLRRLPTTLRTGQFPPSEREPDDWNEMSKLFTWIRQNTPANAVLASNLDPLFYLATGRDTVRGFVPNGYKTYYQPRGEAVTAYELSESIRRYGINYVVLTPDRDFPESPAFHKSVLALERGGVLEPVPVPGLASNYRLLKTTSARF